MNGHRPQFSFFFSERNNGHRTPTLLKNGKSREHFFGTACSSWGRHDVSSTWRIWSGAGGRPLRILLILEARTGAHYFSFLFFAMVIIPECQPTRPMKTIR